MPGRATQHLIHRPFPHIVLTQVVAVPVDDPPLAVLPPVEVGDAQCVVLDRARVERGVLVSDRVGQLAADASRDVTGQVPKIG